MTGPAHHLRYDPASRCRPVAEWPVADQQAWAAALRPALRMRDRPGALSHLRLPSRSLIEKAYGRWLTWLGEPVASEGSATAAATPDAVVTFARHLLERNAPLTVLQRVRNLKEALRALAPGQDWGFVADIEAQVRAAAGPVRDKRAKLKSAWEVFELGCALMETAPDAGTPVDEAGQFRDGLVIALLAARPLRMRTLTLLEVRRHLVRRSDGWWLAIGHGEHKGKGRLEFPIPEELEQAIEYYLAVHRPVLLDQGSPPPITDRLWISTEGRVMKENAIGVRINAETKKAFGHSLNPHMFRDIAATSVAIEDPAHVGVVTRLLGHSSPATAERYYNLAGTIEAVKNWQDEIARRRRDEGKPEP